MLRRELISRNSLENIEKRQILALDYQRSTNRKIHLYETNFNLFTLKKFGRSYIGSGAIVPVRASKGVNLKVTLEIDDNGTIVRIESQIGPIKLKFINFMTALSDSLAKEEIIVYLDNAPIHRKQGIF